MKNTTKSQKLDILAFGPHPDDVEAGAAGMLIKYVCAGKKVGIIDLSRAERSSNGTKELRIKEAKRATKIMGVAVRENLNLPDALLFDSQEVRMKVFEVVRRYRPNIVLIPYWHDRHPDHATTGDAVFKALFTAGLTKIKSKYRPHRPSYVFFYRLWYDFRPTFILDISEEFETKMRAIKAYKSQFLKSEGYISTKNTENDFLGYWRARHKNYGYEIGVEYGEPYLSVTPLGVKDLDSILPNYS